MTIKRTFYVLICTFLCSNILTAQVFKKIQSEGEGLETCEELDQLNTIFITTFTLRNLNFVYTGGFCEDVLNAPCDLYIGHYFEGFGEPIFEEVTSCMFNEVKQTKTDIIYSGTLTHRFSLSDYIDECDDETFTINYNLNLYCKGENGDFTPVDFCSDPAFFDIMPPGQLISPCSLEYKDFDLLFCCEDPEYTISTTENIEILSVTNDNINLNYINLPGNSSKKDQLPYIIMNTSGQVLKRGFTKSENNISLNISDLRSGLYFIAFETEKGIITKKIFK